MAALQQVFYLIFSAKCLVQSPKDKVIPCFSAKYLVERKGQLVQILILISFSANSIEFKKFSAKSAFELKCIQCKVQDVCSLVHILKNKLVQSMQCKVLSIKYEVTSGFEFFQCKMIPNSLVQSTDKKICSADSLLAQKQGLVQTPSLENLLVQFPNLEMTSAKSLFLFSAFSKQQHVQDNFPTMCQCNFLTQNVEFSAISVVQSGLSPWQIMDMAFRFLRPFRAFSVIKGLTDFSFL